MFCGSAAYFEVVKIVVDAYNSSVISRQYSLVLIIAGNESQLKMVRDYAPNAVLMTKLPYEELVRAYNRAKVLLIPLRDSIKDISRFPNKVCEYAASKSVIVTTKYGEPAHFFEDKKSALIADDYSSTAIAEQLDWIATHPSEIESIVMAGYNVGLMNFELSAHKSRCKSFIESLFE
jgi:glycosyltransferase involved in cell wall biosynthesis